MMASDRQAEDVQCSWLQKCHLMGEVGLGPVGSPIERHEAWTLGRKGNRFSTLESDRCFGA